MCCWQKLEEEIERIRDGKQKEWPLDAPIDLKKSLARRICMKTVSFLPDSMSSVYI